MPDIGPLAPYYGGKYYHAAWINSLLPPNERITRYVEPFAGMATVLLRRPKPNWRAVVETLNDTDRMLYNLFRLLTALAGADAAVALSGYHSELYDDMLHDWDVAEREAPAYAKRGENTRRTEVLWRNARCVELAHDTDQGDLF